MSILITALSLSIFAQFVFAPVGYIAYAQDDTGEQQERQFVANLTGQAQIPPVVTNASGLGTFTLNEDGDEISYELDVEDIEGVTGAHIHWGNPQRNGPILVTLYNESEPTDEVDGSLTDGDFTSEDFEATLPARESSIFQTIGQNMSSLVTLIEEGRTYVNVHTEAFPDGEIRGTIGEVQELNDQEGNDDGNDDDN